MAYLSPSTLKLHAGLIRLSKGMISAWEEWAKANTEPPKVELNPDPIKHFKQQK